MTADFNHVAQDTIPETGLGCLALVFSFYQDSLDLEAARHSYIKPGEVSDAGVLVRIARSAGYKSSTKISSVKRIDTIPLPVIGQHKDGRFFVMGRRTEQGMLVGMGGGAPIDYSLQRLEEEWSGRVVYIARRISDKTAGKTFGLSWFLPVMQRFRHILAEVIVVSVFIQLIALVGPLFSQVVIDKVLVHRGLTTLQVLCLGLVVVNIADALLNGMRSYTFAHTTSRMDAILGTQLFQHLMNLPIAYFESRQTGQTVARLRELENIRQFITSSALTLTIDVVFGLIFLLVMFWYSWSLALIVVASIPVYALISIVITPVLKGRVQDKFQRGAANQSMLVECLAGMQTLKAMAVEPQMRMLWEEQLASYITASLRVVTLGASGAQLVSVTSKLTSAAILWFGAQAVINNQLTIGEFVAFNMLAGQISGPVLRLAQLWQDFQQFRLSIERLGDILDTPTEARVSARQNLPRLRGDIRFENIVFRYRPGGVEILRRLTLSITAGEVIGLVGRSGSGKSTLTKLLQRLYIPEQGRVFVDGVDIALIDPTCCAGRLVWFFRKMCFSIAPYATILPFQARHCR